MGETLDTMLACASVGVAIGGGLTYGINDALGKPMPGREYVFGGTLLGAYDAGRSLGLPDNEGSRRTGVLYTFGVGAVGGVCYFIGLGIGHLIKNT